MKNNHILSLLQSNYTTCKVTYAVGEKQYVSGVNKLYTFKTNIEGLKVEDIVVVPSSSAEGFAVCRVKEVHEFPEIDTDAPWDYKWIVSKVDMESYEEILKAEEEALKDLRKMQQSAVRQQALSKMEETFGTSLPKLDVPKRRL